MELTKQEIQKKIEHLRTGKFWGRQHRIHMNNGKDKPLCNVKKWQCLTPSYMAELENVECIFCLKRILTKLNDGNDGIPPRPKGVGYPKNTIYMKYILGYTLGDNSQTFKTESVYELEKFIEKLLIIKQTDSEYLQLDVSKTKDTSSTNFQSKVADIIEEKYALKSTNKVIGCGKETTCNDKNCIHTCGDGTWYCDDCLKLNKSELKEEKE